MAALLAGARLVLRRGLCFLPAYTVRPAVVPVRCLSRSPRFLTTAVQDENAIDKEPLVSTKHLHDALPPYLNSQLDQLFAFESRLKKTQRISKRHFFNTFNEVCKSGSPSSYEAWSLLQACGSKMPAVLPSERTEIVDTVWSKLQELGVVFNESHYNVLLKVYLENEHKFSPTEFLSRMEAAQLHPDQNTYQGLIAAYCSTGDIQGASKILSFMKSINLAITEDVFSSLITGHARSGDMESAKDILSVMEGAGLTPGRTAYLALLCAYAEKGDIENIKQVLREREVTMTDAQFLKVLYCLIKAGHSQFLPDIFEHMQTCAGYTHDMLKLCIKLLTQGFGDEALEIAKRFYSTPTAIIDFKLQPGNFFIQHCVNSNMPASIFKKYVPELQESKLHCSPLQYALFCALRERNKDLALDLMRVMKEEGIPLREHYCWPLLASFLREKDVEGFLQILHVMKEMNVDLSLHTFEFYVAELFESVESPESILQGYEFKEEFNDLYLSVLKGGLKNRNLKRVDSLLSSKIPLFMPKSLYPTFFNVFPRVSDVEILAKITKRLVQDGSSLQKLSSETEYVGYFLYGLIDSMSGSVVQVKEEHLKQYFYQLKQMEVGIGPEKAEKIIQLLTTRNAPLLIEVVKQLVSSQQFNHKTKGFSALKKQLEILETTSLPYGSRLRELFTVLVENKDLGGVLELTSKYGSDFNFDMYMKVMMLCCYKSKAKEALKIKQEINRRGFTEIPSIDEYKHLFTVVASNGLIEDANNILKEMQERGLAVENFSSGLFLQVFNNLSRKGDVDNVNLLHEQLLMLGLIKPTNQFCAPLVMVHLNRNDPSAALDALINVQEKYKVCSAVYFLLLKMVEMGETVLLEKAVEFLGNTIGEMNMFQELIFVFIELGKYAEAQKIAETPGLRANLKKVNWVLERYKRLNMIEAMEKSVEITQKMYGSDKKEMYSKLLSLYGNKDWSKAIPLWHKMKEEGVEVTDETLAQFIELFKKNGENVFAYIPDLKTKHDQTSSYEVSSRVLGLCAENNLKDAYEVFMENKQIPLSTNIYPKLIKQLLLGGLMDDALKVEAVAKSHFSDFSMQTVSRNLLLAEQVRRDCLKDALVTLESLLMDGKMPTRPTVCRLTEAFAMRGDLASLEEMEAITTRSSVRLNYLDTQYINTKLLAHFTNKNFDEATSMIESLCIENPQLPLYYLLIRLMQNNMSEAIEKASIVLERLSNQFSVYHPVTDLFFAYLKFGKVEEANHLLQRCSAILEQVEFLCQHVSNRAYGGQKQHVDELLDILKDPIYKQVGYQSLMKRYITRKKFDDALALFESMKAEQIELNEDSLKLLATSLRNAGKPVPFPEPQESVPSFSEEESYTSSPSDEKH